MLEDLLAFDSFPSKDELLFLLLKALPLSRTQTQVDLKKYCTSHHFSIARSFEGSMKLLEFMGLITISNGLVSLNDALVHLVDNADPREYFEKSEFMKTLLLAVKRDRALTEFIRPEAMRREASKGTFYVKGSLVPVRYFPLRNLMLSIGFFERDTRALHGDLYVNPIWAQLFQELFVTPARIGGPSRQSAISLKELMARLAMQASQGDEAEKFALAFERLRLHGHPYLSSVTRVSEDWVNAGYDIESFTSEDTILPDRYIEVKSYSQRPAFYWSRHEIETARALAERYFLYLVNRDAMGQPGYAPRILQDPYRMVFESEFWTKDPESWQVSPVETSIKNGLSQLGEDGLGGISRHS